MSTMRPSKGRRSKDSTEASSATDAPAVSPKAEKDKQRCPQCKDDDQHNDEDDSGKENWVCCEGPCRTWFHWRCVGDGGDLDAIHKWYEC